MNDIKKFSSEDTILLCNVWDAASCQIAEKLGFSVLGTSSAAIAKNLGKEDGENIDFSDLLSVVRKMVSSVDTPLTVDIEAGYGSNATDIVNNISELAALGVIGINIEDSTVVNDVRKLRDAGEFADLLSQIVNELKERDIQMFINARTDTFIVGAEHALEKTIERAKMYEESGANGVFVPCITELSDIESVVKSTSLPINVMCMPGLANFTELKESGVKRISMGNFVHQSMLDFCEQQLNAIIDEQSFSPLFN